MKLDAPESLKGLSLGEKERKRERETEREREFYLDYHIFLCKCDFMVMRMKKKLCKTGCIRGP